MQPPRALWVPFPLGKPLGKPGDADFQLDVITAALDLLNRSEGPVLEDYPHDAPSVAAESAPACPVSFAWDTADDGSWKSRLSQKLGQLRPRYELSRRRRGGRTLVGVGDSPPELNVEALAERLDAGTLPTDITWLKQAIEDIKAYYPEALTAQSGDHDERDLQARFWQETRFGAAVLAIHRQFRESDDDRLKLIARLLAPREAVGAATGPSGGNTR